MNDDENDEEAEEEEDEKINPFHPNSEDSLSDLSNDNNKKDNIGNDLVNFSINPNEVKDIIKNLEKTNDEEKSNFYDMITNIQNNLEKIKDIYNKNKNYKEKEKEVEEIINIGNDIRNKYDDMIDRIKKLNLHKKIPNNNNQ